MPRKNLVEELRPHNTPGLGELDSSDTSLTRQAAARKDYSVKKYYKKLFEDADHESEANASAGDSQLNENIETNDLVSEPRSNEGFRLDEQDTVTNDSISEPRSHKGLDLDEQDAVTPDLISKPRSQEGIAMDEHDVVTNDLISEPRSHEELGLDEQDTIIKQVKPTSAGTKLAEFTREALANEDYDVSKVKDYYEKLNLEDGGHEKGADGRGGEEVSWKNWHTWDSWDFWRVRKEKTLSVLAKFEPAETIFFPRTSPTDDPAVAVVHFVRNDVHLFEPTLDQYLNHFDDLMKLAYEVAGHDQGVAKVIVPEEELKARFPSISPADNSSAQHVIETFFTNKTKLREAPSSNETVFYEINNEEVDKLEATDVRSMMQQVNENRRYLEKKKRQMSKRGLSGLPTQEKIVTEEDAIQESLEDQSGIIYVAEREVSQSLRKSLECEDPRVDHESINLLLQSRINLPGINVPLITVSHQPIGSGLVFPLQLGQLAATTLLYHHRGCKRTYTVVKPTSIRALEELVHDTSDPSIKKVAPKCDQFVRHASIYVPVKIFKQNGVDYTTLHQNKGELLLIFPWTYYQGYNTGPNIIEELAFGDDIWKQQYRKNLYQRCGYECDKEMCSFDLDFTQYDAPDAAIGHVSEHTGSKHERAWSSMEQSAAIECMKAVLQERQNHDTNWKWAVISDHLRDAHGIDRSPDAVRLWWSRHGRSLSRIDERKVPDPLKLSTSKDNPDRRNKTQRRWRQKQAEMQAKDTE